MIEGRRYISVIGIDRYRRWNPLRNAVNDARGVLAAFTRLGFTSVGEPLLDDAATGEAIRRLPTSLARELGGSDSLVVFFAGHGHTTTAHFPDGYHVTKGYLIPVDAARGQQHDDTWQRVEHWLTTIAELPPRHILVILDSCHSGIALSRNIQHRGVGVRTDHIPTPFRARRSRRVLTSALDDQRAMDGGPVPGHSVFTGCLIDALGGATTTLGRASSVVGMNELAVHVSNRVREHSGATQVPGMGWLELDDNGELMLPLGPPVASPPPLRPKLGAAPRRQARRSSGRSRSSAARPEDPYSTGSAPHATSTVPAQPAEPPSAPCGPPERTEGWLLDPALAAELDHHGQVRRRGACVLTIVGGEAMAAQTLWGTWAARHGYLTLATQSVGIDAVIADLLAQTPWLRCVSGARARLAAAARIDMHAVDASLDARSMPERRRWIDDVAALDPHARVSGWLLSWLRSAAASVPDLTTVPVRHGELLAIACDLSAPTAVLLFHPAPTERWLEHAIVTAAQLINDLPAHSVAVTAPDELVTRVLADAPSGTAWTMAREGRVRVAALARRLPGRARHSTMRVLHDALARDPRTRGHFELDGTVGTAGGSAIDVALLAREARIAVELDAWYHFHDPEGYGRDRVQDTRLQRAGYFVLRFPAEDVDDRLASTIEHLAIALAGRRAVSPPR
ncbi:MAG: caspase family protein [Myxococcales bacterium]|nr:caspase family protein [Myxococcales bacterium]